MDDECRGVRQRRKQTDPTCCPVCGITVRSHEIEQHFSMEVDRLHKLSIHKGRKLHAKEMSSEIGAAGCSTSGASTTLALATTSINETNASDGKECWMTYQRIKNNRNARLKLKNRKRKADDPMCPVCNERIPDDLSVHVELCLRRIERNNGNSGENGDADDDDDSIDVEGESYEEYEWAGQTRIRVSSLLEGGYSATGLQTSIINNSNHANEDDDDEDLNVDGDDSQVYGQPQYSERDIILPIVDDNKKENLYLRNLVIGEVMANENTAKQKYLTDHKNGIDTAMNGCSNKIDASTSAGPSPSSAVVVQDTKTTSRSVAATEIKCESTASSSTITIDLKDGSVKETIIVANQSQSPLQTNDTAAAHIIEALKEKIREYEVIIKNKSKCLICMDEFRIPVVSICCWHVHCEECWLRTLGARKLCPQCNMITSPTDLRRIYM